MTIRLDELPLNQLAGAYLSASERANKPVEAPGDRLMKTLAAQQSSLLSVPGVQPQGGQTTAGTVPPAGELRPAGQPKPLGLVQPTVDQATFRPAAQPAPGQPPAAPGEPANTGIFYGDQLNRLRQYSRQDVPTDVARLPVDDRVYMTENNTARIKAQSESRQALADLVASGEISPEEEARLLKEIGPPLHSQNLLDKFAAPGDVRPMTPAEQQAQDQAGRRIFIKDNPDFVAASLRGGGRTFAESSAMATQEASDNYRRHQENLAKMGMDPKGKRIDQSAKSDSEIANMAKSLGLTPEQLRNPRMVDALGSVVAATGRTAQDLKEAKLGLIGKQNEIENTKSEAVRAIGDKTIDAKLDMLNVATKTAEDQAGWRKNMMDVLGDLHKAQLTALTSNSKAELTALQRKSDAAAASIDLATEKIRGLYPKEQPGMHQQRLEFIDEQISKAQMNPVALALAVIDEARNSGVELDAPDASDAQGLVAWLTKKDNSGWVKGYMHTLSSKANAAFLNDHPIPK